MTFEFIIQQKAADEILSLTKEIKNFENHTVSQGDNKNATIGKKDSNKVSQRSLKRRPCNTESDKIDISKYKNISITKGFREKYGTRIDEKNSRKIDKPNVSEGNKESFEIVDIKRGGVEGGAIIKLEDDKKYMLKGLYRVKGKYLYKPNAKNNIKAFFTRKGIDGINKSVIEEYVALKLANVVHKGISPDVKLGKIEHKDNKGGNCKYQYCLMTEMAGQKKEEGEEFHTLKEILDKNKNPNANTKKVNELNQVKGNMPELSSDLWQNAFTISVLLLNDRDVNKTDNIGVVYKDNKAIKLSLFDLGHPTPDKYELDPKTLLPKSMNVLEKVALWIMNLFVKTKGWQFKIDENIRAQLGGPEDRAETIRNLLERKKSVFYKLDEIRKNFQDTTDRKQIEEFKSKIEKRFAQLEKVLNEYNNKYKKTNEK